MVVWFLFLSHSLFRSCIHFRDCGWGGLKSWKENHSFRCLWGLVELWIIWKWRFRRKARGELPPNALEESVVGACDWPEDVDLNPTCSVEERQEPFGRDTQRRNLKRKAHINCGNNTRGDKHLAPSGPNEQMTSNDFPFMIWFYRRELFDRNTTV